MFFLGREGRFSEVGLGHEEDGVVAILATSASSLLACAT
jgi:hypothetical protein